MPREAAYQTLYAMQQTVERGTARSLQNDYADLRLAGKTGTTNDALSLIHILRLNLTALFYFIL